MVLVKLPLLSLIHHTWAGFEIFVNTFSFSHFFQKWQRSHPYHVPPNNGSWHKWCLISFPMQSCSARVCNWSVSMNTAHTENMTASNLDLLISFGFLFQWMWKKKSQGNWFLAQTGKSNISFTLKFWHFPYNPCWNYPSVNQRTITSRG